MSNENVANIEKNIEARMSALFEKASEMVDSFWITLVAKKEELPYSEWGKHGVRARRRGFSIQIEWSRVRFVGKKGNKKPHSDYIPRGRTCDRYHISLFRRGPEWEQKLIDELENKFALIRREVEILRKLHRLNMEHAAFLEKNGDVVS